MKTLRISFIGLLLLSLVAGALAQLTDRPPSWAVGTFNGYNEWQKADIELTINNDGKIDVVKRNDRGDSRTSAGFYRRGRVQIGSSEYEIYQSGGGIRLDNRDNTRDSMNLRRGSLGRWNDRPGTDFPTATSIMGHYAGRNDYRKVDVDLDITRDSATLVHRVLRNAQSWKGKIRGNELDFGWVRYRVQRNGDGVEIVNPDESRDRARLRRTGGGNTDNWPNNDRIELEIKSPRDERMRVDRNGVLFEGTSNADEIRIEVFRGRDRVANNTINVRSGRFSTRLNLAPAKYESTITAIRDRRTVATRRVNFEVTGGIVPNSGGASLQLDNPSNRGVYRPGDIEFSGYSNGDKVRIEVYRGRDRVYSGQVGMDRDDRFSARANLGEGRYDATIYAVRDGRTYAEKKISFEIRRS